MHWEIQTEKNYCVKAFCCSVSALFSFFLGFWVFFSLLHCSQLLCVFFFQCLSLSFFLCGFCAWPVFLHKNVMSGCSITPIPDPPSLRLSLPRSLSLPSLSFSLFLSLSLLLSLSSSFSPLLSDLLFQACSLWWPTLSYWDSGSPSLSGLPRLHVFFPGMMMRACLFQLVMRTVSLPLAANLFSLSNTPALFPASDFHTVCEMLSYSHGWVCP